MPGEDPSESARAILGELPVLPFLPELPARGAGADLTGRTTALLADLYVDLQPSGWRMTPRPSRDGQRAKDWLARDLDALEESGVVPPALKVQCAGPGRWPRWSSCTGAIGCLPITEPSLILRRA